MFGVDLPSLDFLLSTHINLAQSGFDKEVGKKS